MSEIDSQKQAAKTKRATSFLTELVILLLVCILILAGHIYTLHVKTDELKLRAERQHEVTMMLLEDLGNHIERSARRNEQPDKSRQ